MRNTLPAFLIHLINETRDYVMDVRKDAIDFNMWFDNEDGLYKAQFTYGRVGAGSKIEAACAAISNAITAIDETMA